MKEKPTLTSVFTQVTKVDAIRVWLDRVGENFHLTGVQSLLRFIKCKCGILCALTGEEEGTQIQQPFKVNEFTVHLNHVEFVKISPNTINAAYNFSLGLTYNNFSFPGAEKICMKSRRYFVVC